MAVIVGLVPGKVLQVPIVVTAEDGITSLSYTVCISAAAWAAAGLLQTASWWQLSGAAPMQCMAKKFQRECIAPLYLRHCSSRSSLPIAKLHTMQLGQKLRARCRRAGWHTQGYG